MLVIYPSILSVRMLDLLSKLQTHQEIIAFGCPVDLCKLWNTVLGVPIKYTCLEGTFVILWNIHFDIYLKQYCVGMINY